MKDRHLSKSTASVGWGEFLSKLEYKFKREGKHLIRVSRWFPSSQTCCTCGYRNREVRLHKNFTWRADNRMLVTFIVEDMNYKKLQKRAKNTERQEKVTPVPQKDGGVKLVRKYKRKKRFGRSLNNRSPALFLSMLEQKAARYGGGVRKADTMKFKASQYNHAVGRYEKIPLSQRFREVGGHQVQRDLYSAYLLSNSQKNLKAPNRRKCAAGFEGFCRLMNEKIGDMKEKGVSMRQCFGF